MTNESYKLTRDRAKHELQDQLRRRVKLDQDLETVNTRIAELTQAVQALDLLVGDASTSDTKLMLEIASLPLSEAVKELLRRSDSHLTALEISRDLRRLGFRESEYINPQASIHTMLKRLVANGQADTILKDGKIAYRLLPEG